MAGVDSAASKPLKSFLSPLLRSKDSSFSLTNTRNNRVVAGTLLTAFDSATRRKGLLGRDSLADDTAMIIAPSNAVHTFAMRFAIDIAFVAKDGRVLKVRRAVKPRRLAAAWGAFAVVELAAGALERSQTQKGDVLQVTPQ